MRGNGISGFSATGIYPFNRNAVPDYFYAISDSSMLSHHVNSTTVQPIIDKTFLENDDNYVFFFEDEINEPSASTTKINDTGADTPSKILFEIAPVPQIPINKSKRKQSAKILVHDITIIKPKEENMKKKKEANQKEENAGKGTKRTEAKNKNVEEEMNQIPKDTSRKQECKCTECAEDYYQTSEVVDWIECISCLSWLHESCTMYGDHCNQCGRVQKRKLMAAKRKL